MSIPISEKQGRKYFCKNYRYRSIQSFHCYIFLYAYKEIYRQERIMTFNFGAPRLMKLWGLLQIEPFY